MFKAKLISVFLSLKALLSPCEFDHPAEKPQISVAGRFDKSIAEASGLQYWNTERFWVIQDGGNGSTIYLTTADGSIDSLVNLPLTNYDWEAVSGKPSDSLLFIGDFGNNYQSRKNLRIYKIHPNGTDTIRFSYANQDDFTSDKGKNNFDCEAMVWYKGQLHLFSKAWGNKVVRHYQLPDTGSTYKVSPLEEIKLKGLVTDAAISPSGKKLALLTYGKVYLFTLNEDGNWFSNSPVCFKIPWAGQTEGLTFVNESRLLVCNETGKLWTVHI